MFLCTRSDLTLDLEFLFIAKKRATNKQQQKEIQNQVVWKIFSKIENVVLNFEVRTWCVQYGNSS